MSQCSWCDFNFFWRGSGETSQFKDISQFQCQITQTTMMIIFCSENVSICLFYTLRFEKILYPGPMSLARNLNSV